MAKLKMVKVKKCSSWESNLHNDGQPLFVIDYRAIPGKFYIYALCDDCRYRSTGKSYDSYKDARKKVKKLFEKGIKNYEYRSL